MAMSIGGHTIPSPMADGGDYQFQRQVLAKNGAGAAVEGPATLTWKWEILTLTEWQYWTSTLLGGGMSAEFSSASLYNDDQSLTSYTHCIVNRPTYSSLEAGCYLGVTVTIEQIK